MTEISPEAWSDALLLLDSVNVASLPAPSVPGEPADKQLDVAKIVTTASNTIVTPVQVPSDKIITLEVTSPCG